MNPLPGSHLIRFLAILAAAPKSLDARNTRLAHPRVSGTPKKQRPGKQAFTHVSVSRLVSGTSFSHRPLSRSPQPGEPKELSRTARQTVWRFENPESSSVRAPRKTGENRGRPLLAATAIHSAEGEKSALRGDGQPPNGFLSGGNPSRRVSDILTSLSQETALPQWTQMLFVSSHSHNHKLFLFSLIHQYRIPFHSNSLPPTL